MATTTTPNTMPIPVWGISRTLEGCIVLSENISQAGQAYEVRDQQNRLTGKTYYDSLITLTLSVEAAAGTSFKDGDTLTYDSQKWKISQASEVGSYQDKSKWEITAERAPNWTIG